MEHLTVEASGERLDKYLASRYPDVSRSAIQKLIKAGQVTVNNKASTPHLALRAGDRLSFELTAAEPDRTPDGSLPVALLAEDDQFLVVDKPAGLVVHPAAGRTDKTLVNWLIARVPAITSVGDDPDRPGLVHRLDADASGVLVIAKTPAAFDHLKAEFQAHRVAKEYQVLVNGRLSADEGEINFPIGRAASGAFAVGDSVEHAKPAQTFYSVVQRYQHFTLLKVSTTTGRTHQIRVHLKAIGHSVAGDKLYHTRNVKPAGQPNRLFLHAASIAFTDATGSRRRYEAPLPADLVQFLETLKPAAG